MDESEKVEQQRRLYGAPIGTLVHEATARLGITQARVAAVLGLSPAMMSQLVGGHRVKIGNPQAVARLQQLLALADESASLSRDAVAERLEEIRSSHASLTTGQLATPAADTAQTAETLRRVLHAVASGRELDQAARLLDDTAPGLAELIRAYGTGSPDDAARHLASIAHLL
jgi:predicted transcriptional regulator